jgi:glycosyltransferase involved in cell wall biosynthesis
LSALSDLTVYYAHRQSAEGQAEAGFGTPFEWDVPLLEGYEWHWLENVARRPGLASFSGCDTPGIGPIIRRERFDAFLIFGWSYKCFVQAAWAARLSGTPVLVRVDSQLVTPRSIGKRFAKRLIYPLLLRMLGQFMSPGQRTDEYLRHYGVPADRIHRIPHMIDTERFSKGAALARTSGQALALRRRIGAEQQDFVLLFVGRLIREKRPMLMLQALEALRRDTPELASRIKLWIVGDGPFRAELESYSVAHDLPVIFYGFANQSELPAVYAAADTLVLVSTGQETWGLVVNEAFACGLPAIVSIEAGCSTELIRENETGWLLREGDPKSLARLYARAVAAAGGLPREAIETVNRHSSYTEGIERVLMVVERLRLRRRAP